MRRLRRSGDPPASRPLDHEQLRHGLRGYAGDINARPEIGYTDSLDGGVTWACEWPDPALDTSGLAGTGVHTIAAFQIDGNPALLVEWLADGGTDDAAEDPFGRARALLALGETRRRLRQKRTAREAIEAALAAFVELGAGGWATTARESLARIGGRQRVEGLSPSELAVAALVAEGRTNREIAAALFLGERTVAGHLTHIYAKLGIRSRTELAGKLRPASDISASDAGKVAKS